MQPFDPGKRYLVTGAAGFIGFHLITRLLNEGASVTGFDNVNDYYDVRLKEDRLKVLEEHAKSAAGDFRFVKGDLADRDAVFSLFEEMKPQVVVHLAAQAGVRYSIDHPEAYISANITGHFHMLEACRAYPVEHLLFASSSSVYGGNTKVPFSESDKVDEPVSLYAATKKADELMSHAYAKLYGIPSTGLRFFTVYGPYGRPDMALFLFADKIMRGEKIEVFNYGDMERDFTYVDDIVTGIMNMLCNPPADNGKGARYKIYNIGNHHPEKLTDFIRILEEKLGRTAEKEMLPIQPGDVPRTFADVSELERDFGFKPDTPLEVGIGKFTDWFLDYYHYAV